MSGSRTKGSGESSLTKTFQAIRLSGPVELPADVLAQSARRVLILAVVGAVFFGAALALLIIQPAPDREGLGMIPVAVAGLAVSAAAALVLYGEMPVEQKLRLGLLYHVVMGFQIAVLELPRVTGEDVLLNGISSVAVWQLLFPGLVPTTKRSLIAATSAISLAIPVTAAGAALLGRSIDGSAVLVSALPVLVAGGVGIAIGRVVYGLSKEVAEARDVGSYRLQTKLGDGGMGEVWIAEHRLLARPAAVKLIKADVLATAASPKQGTEDPRVLFEREAGAIANLRSPHTVELYDYGVRDDGVFFYVMELLDGFDLWEMLAKHGRLPISRALLVLQGMCLSLAEAHEAGLVHRDIKPANIFLARLGTSYDIVKVLDFGLVQETGTPPLDSGDGETVSIAGTPETIAPEVARGYAATAASDMYAVGCVAFWLLTRRLPFQDRDIPTLLFAHANREPPSLGDLVEVPRELALLVDRLLAKDPAERPTAAMVAEALTKLPDWGAWTMGHAAAWWAEHK